MYDIDEVIFEIDDKLKKDEYSVYDIFNLKEISENKYDVGDDEESKIISLDKIVKVNIITTDWGPFLCDSYLVIFTDDKQIFITEQDAPFYMILYNAVSKLEGFDYESVIKAMSCVEKDVFTCYRRDRKD